MNGDLCDYLCCLQWIVSFQVANDLGLFQEKHKFSKNRSKQVPPLYCHCIASKIVRTIYSLRKLKKICQKLNSTTFEKLQAPAKIVIIPIKRKYKISSTKGNLM